MIFGELNAAAMLVERISRSFHAHRRPTDSLVSRFVRMFEAHGVVRNQISRFFGHGLTPAALQTDESLLPLLTDEVLDAATQMLGVRRSWLDGADDQIYPVYDFYKRPEYFAQFVENLKSRAQGLIGVVVIPDDRRRSDLALLIFQEEIGQVGNCTVYRYHLANNWRFNYWKSRAYLVACIAQSWRRSIFVLGRCVSTTDFQKYGDGKTFFTRAAGSDLPMGGKTWNPEDLALYPSSFVEGLDTEQGGVPLGLRLWLELDAQGFMATGINEVRPREAFLELVSKYEARSHLQHRRQMSVRVQP